MGQSRAEPLNTLNRIFKLGLDRDFAMADVLKDIYFAAEDKWYAGLDWLDRHHIPVYKVIDPIDTKIPSFALAAGVLGLFVLLTLFSFAGFFAGGTVNVAFQVVDDESSPLPNIPIQFSYNGVQGETHISNSLGRIELQVPNGTRIDYEVDLETYELVSKSVSAREDTLEVIQLSPLQSQTLTKTIKLVNEVGQPILKEASLTFACSTAYGRAPNPITGTGGTYSVTPNADCIPLSVSVAVDGYEAVQSYPITAQKDVYLITLVERTIRDATLNVTVLDPSSIGVSGMDVSLQKNGIEVDQSQTGAGGTTTFSIAAGEYTVVATDNANGVYSTAQDTVYVATGEVGDITLNVTKNANAQMEVLVIDKQTSQPLRNVIVKLKQGNTILHTQTTNTDGRAVLAVTDRTQTYLVSASREGYVPQQKSVSGTTGSTSFALERATGSNTTKLRVHLTDQDGDAVADAKVILYNADTGFLAPYEAVLSDSNGIGTFTGVSTGNYQAFAYKTSLTAYSSEQFFDIADPSTQDYDIKLNVPDGTVDIHVVDLDGNPVPFAKVSVYNAFKNTLLGADLTDTNGSYELPRNNQKSKADKDVYVTVSKNGFASVTTIQKPVLPDTVQAFNVVLPPTDPRGPIAIELLGLYSTDGKIVTGVGKGRDFTARFRVNIPEEHDDLDTMLVHVRTGDKDIVEKDDWYITKVLFPRAGVVKGGAWDPANGLNEDGASITNGPAKWINAFVSDPAPGVYEFETQVHVRDTAAAQDILKMFYKVTTQNGDTLRDPVDANPTDELYAATKQATYQVGVTTICDADFCFDASILDTEDARIEDVVESFSAKVFTDYKLTFNLLNNGNNFHTNANLRIKASNDGINFTTYELYNADAQLQSGTVNDNEFKAPLNVGNFTPQKKIGGSITFRPTLAGTSIIVIELVSDFKSVFSKSIQINTTGDKTMRVTVDPDFFPSQIPIQMNVHAEDDGTGEELMDATVTLKTVTGILLASAKTDGAGNATIELPGQFPGKKVELRVEKAEYNPYVQQLPISDKIATLTPATLGVTLNAKTQTEKTGTFTLTNETSLPIVIRKMAVQGNVQGLLDTQAIDASLLPYVGVTIAPKSQLQVNLRTVLTTEGRALTEHVDLDAVIGIEIQNYGSPWNIDLPVRYSLGVGSEVDDPTCFTAVPNSWVTSTDGKTVTYEFQIQNNCAIAGNPSTLQNLSARANWSTSELGELTLSVFEQNNPTAIGAAKVRSGYFSPVLTGLPPQDVLVARLDFVPFAGVKGQGSFDVELQASNPLEGKPQLLSSKIHSEIGVVNLSDCVIYDKEILDLQPGKKDTLTIETRGCGAPVDFTLQSELELSTKEFTLQGTDKKAIDVSDDQLDLGQYPLYVNVEGAAQKLPTQNKVIRARIRDPNACVQLNRYEFDVYNDPQNANDGFDTARLDNLCVNQKVAVKVVIQKKFMDSLKKGLTAGIIAFVGTGASNLLNDIPFGGPASAAAQPPAATPGASQTNLVLPSGKKVEVNKLDSGKTELVLPREITLTPAEADAWTLQGFDTTGFTAAMSALTHAGANAAPAGSTGIRIQGECSPTGDTSTCIVDSALPPGGVGVSSVDGKPILRVSNTVQVGEPLFPNGSLFSIRVSDAAAVALLKAAIRPYNGNQDPSTGTDGALTTILLPAGTTYHHLVNGNYEYELPRTANNAPALRANPTGLAILLETKASTIGQQAANSALGSGLKNALGKITGELSLGTKSPFVSFGVTTLAITALDYFLSKDQEYRVEVLGKDVQITDLRVIAGEKGANESQLDTDVTVEKSGVALNPKLNLDKPVVGRVESSTLTFNNNSGFRDQMIFRNLLASGTRFEYAADQKYTNDVPDENRLRASKETNFQSRFHLQFNSIPPESLASTGVPPIALSCDTFSEKTGKTGALAAPKVKFAWNFQAIGPNACDAGQLNSSNVDAAIYCDATQFSIEVIQKVQLLRSFIQANAPFACPLENGLTGNETQPIPAADIGIASLNVDRTGSTDLNVIIGIQNNSPAINHARVTIEYKLAGVAGNPSVLEKDVTVPISSFVKVGFPLSGLGTGTYNLTARIIPEACENCFNSVPASDALATQFFMGENTGLVACEPFSTKRLDAFISATEAAGRTIHYPNGLNRDQVLKLVHFDAKLMQDRFSNDFFMDFDRYARKVSFFSAPTYYLDQATGLNRFFTDREKWIVNREGTPVNPEGYLLPGPGIYDVTLDINFSGPEMNFYQNGEPSATVNVLIEKTATVEETSPFYSLPFNGLIGTDDGQGRVGYGVDYSGEPVRVNESSSETIQTIDIADSTPVATVQTSKVDAYTILNSLERGNILTLTKNGTNQLALKWSPSFATPVIMSITGNNAKSNAYGYYSVGVNNDTSQSYIGAKGNPWYGVGPNCRDFQDASLLDAYSPRYDASAVNADCALVGAQENIAYGFEWCENTIHVGSVPLKTIFYTPQGSLSTITRAAWKDDMTFVGEGVTGGSVPLNGTNAIPGNTPGDQITSIEEIMNLVKQEAVCVRNSGAKTEFFWNPKEVLNVLAQKEKNLESACIVK